MCSNYVCTQKLAHAAAAPVVYKIMCLCAFAFAAASAVVEATAQQYHARLVHVRGVGVPSMF